MKSKFRKVLSMLLIIVIIAVSAPLAGFVGVELPSLTELFAIKAEAISGTCGENLNYTLNTDTGILEIFGTGDMKNWTSPSNSPWTYNSEYRNSIKSINLGEGVTSIGDYAFYACENLVSVTIPQSITNIGKHAFHGCEFLATVDLPDEITNLGDNIFEGCSSLTSIVIPNKLTSVGYHAFYACSSLLSVTFPDSITRIGDGAFGECLSLISAEIPNGVTYIGIEAFKNCALTDLLIPNSVTYIGDEAFRNNAIENVVIPDSVTLVGRHVFTNTGYYNNENNWKDGALYNGKYLIAVKEDYSGAFEIKDGTEVVCGGAFFWRENITAITIPNTVKTLGSGAFCGCTSLTSMVVPDSVTVMDRSIFTGCKSLTNVKLSKNITSIEGATFNGCTNLTNIVIPEGVVQIGIYAFDLCTNLKTITIPKSLKFVDQLAFIQIENLEFLNYNGTSHDWYSINIHPTNEILIELYEKNYGKETNYIIPFDYLDRCYDNFIYIASEVYEEDGELTDYMVERGDKLEFRYYIKSDLKIGASKIYTLFDNSFFDVGVLTVEPVLNSSGYETHNENGVVNSKHASVSSTNIHEISSSPLSEDKALNIVGIFDENYISSRDYVSNMFKKDVASEDYNTPFEMTSDEWLISFSVTVKDNVMEGQNGVVESPLSVWQAYYNEEIGRFDTRLPGNFLILESVDENGEYVYRSLSYCMTNGIVDNFIVDDLNHEFTVYEPHSHSYSERVTTDPTCEKTGIKTYECSCGDSYTEIIPETGHKSLDWETAKEATCAEDGEKVKKCETCGEVLETGSIPATGHKSLDWETAKEPTCAEDGEKVKKCETCGETLETDSIPATGHSPGEWEIVAEATEEADGIKIKKCTVCYAETDRETISKHIALEDSESGTEIVYPPDEYEGEVSVVVEEKRDETAFNLINAENPVAEIKIYDIKMMMNGEEIQPATTVTVRIPLPDGFNPKCSYVCHINTKTKKVEMMNATVETINGKLYFVFETTHFSYYAVVENAVFDMSIRTPSITTINYGDSIWLHADIEGELPAGATIKWTSSNNNFEITEISADGKSCKITPKSSGDTTFTATVCDANGNAVSSDEQVMTSKAGFFDKIIAFFKKLFGATKTYLQFYAL